jgi:hypothetical protein
MKLKEHSSFIIPIIFIKTIIITTIITIKFKAIIDFTIIIIKGINSTTTRELVGLFTTYLKAIN